MRLVRLSRGRGGYTRAFYLVVGKFPEFLGVMKFMASRLMRAPTQLIEYK